MLCCGRIPMYPNLKASRNSDVAGMAKCGLSLNDFDYWNANPDKKASFVGTLKYDKPNVEVPAEVARALLIGVEWTEIHFHAAYEEVGLKPLAECIDRLDENTSPGLPWTSLGYFTKKDLHESRGFTDYETYYQDLLTLQSPTCIMTSAMKEELRDKSKLQDGKVRQINGAPCHFAAALNTYRLSFSDALLKGHTVTSSAVGMTHVHGGWNRLFRKLSIHPRGYDGDFKEYDSSQIKLLMVLEAQAHWKALSNKFGWTGSLLREHEVRYWRLTMDEIQSLLLCVTGDLVTKFLGNVSGTPFTTPRNTLILYILLSASWAYKCALTGNKSWCSFEVFAQAVVAALYGDDNTFTVSEEFIGWFTGDVLRDFSGKLGMTFEVDTLPKKVSDLPFLSRSFHIVNGFAFGVPANIGKFRAGLFLRDDGNVCTRLSRLESYRLECAPGVLVDDSGQTAGCRQIYFLATTKAKELLNRYEPLFVNDSRWISVIGQHKPLHQLIQIHKDGENWGQDAGFKSFYDAGNNKKNGKERGEQTGVKTVWFNGRQPTKGISQERECWCCWGLCQIDDCSGSTASSPSERER